MLLLKQFNNVDEFNNVFGIRECGNGNKSRKNKILLGSLKDRTFFKLCAHDWRYIKYLSCNNMADFKTMLLRDIEISSRNHGGYYCSFKLDGRAYNFVDRNMEIDNHGLCEDGDCKSIRYYNHERGRYFKMKAGKFFTAIMEGCEFGRALPQQAKSWLGEEFLTSWQTYAEPRLNNAFEFHYGNDMEDFEKIYSSRNRRGDFHSCMTDKGYHTMYYNACKCHAAWLTDTDGQMFARCIVFDEVHDQTTGETLRLAERQYSDGVQDKFKKMLIDALISRKLIDGYKQIGADCSDNQSFLLNDGTSIYGHRLSIDCELESGNTVSYMDSFVYYNRGDHKAYNYSMAYYTDKLNTTEGRLEDDHENDCWSVYYQEYIPEDEAYYVEERDDYFYGDDVVVDNHGNYQFVDDCEQCADCGKYILRYNMIQVNGLPDNLYFSDSERAANWASEHGYVWSDYDATYYREEDAVMVNRYLGYYSCGEEKMKGYWEPDIISRDDFDYYRAKMHELNGEWYWLESTEARGDYENMTLPALVVA